MRHPNRRPLAAAGPVRALFAALACVLCETAAADEEPVRLDPPQMRSDALSFRLTGRDPGAPRALVLWREDGRRYRRAGETRSGDDGRFSFGERPRPTGALRFVVAPLGEAPDPLHSIRVEGPLPAPTVTAADPSGRLLRIFPALYEGAIQIRDAESGRLLLHRSIDPPSRGGLLLDLDAQNFDPSVRQLEILQRTHEGIPGVPTGWWLD